MENERAALKKKAKKFKLKITTWKVVNRLRRNNAEVSRVIHQCCFLGVQKHPQFYYASANTTKLRTQFELFLLRIALYCDKKIFGLRFENPIHPVKDSLGRNFLL